MARLEIEINTVMDENGNDWETEYRTIDPDELVGAEIIEVIDDSGRNPDDPKIEELRLKLKDGRVIRMTAFEEAFNLGQWSDDN